MNSSVHRRRWSWWGYLLLGLVWAELTLQAVAAGYRWWVTSTHTRPTTAVGFTILCLGDCNTFGVGADTQQSYPRQLERLLRNRWLERRIQVVNEGVPTYNTSQILHRLPGQLREVQPDLVLLLIAGGDLKRFIGVDLATLEVLNVPWLSRVKIRLDQWCSTSYLYRVAKLLVSPGMEEPVTPWRSATVSADAAQGPLPVERFVPGLETLVSANPEIAFLMSPRRERDGTLRHTAGVSANASDTEPSSERLLEELGELRSSRSQRPPYILEDAGKGRGLRLVEVVKDGAPAQNATLVQADIDIQQVRLSRTGLLLEQLIEQDPLNSDLYMQRALVQRAAGDYDGTIASLRTLLTLNPDLAEAYGVLGGVFRRQRKWEYARAMYLRALERDPLNQLFWFSLARMSMKLEQFEQAREAWREGFRRTHSPSHLAGLGQTYQDPDEALEAMRTLLEETRAGSPRDPAYWQPFETLVEYGVHQQMVERLVTMNIERIISQTTQRGARLGLITIPYFSGYKWLNQVLREVASRHPEVLLIDSARALSDRFEDSAQDLLSPEAWNLNAQGYGLVSHYVAEALGAAGVLDAAPLPPPG